MPTPFVSKRAPIYADVPDEKWNDWRWQLSHRLNTAEEIEKVIPLTESNAKRSNTSGLFRVDITPYFISLIDPDDPDDPIRKQVIPARRGDAVLHRDDGGFAGGGPPLARARAGPPLPGPGADAGDHPVRLLLPLLHPLAHRRRPAARPSTARNSRCRSSTSSARRRCAMCCSPAATRWCWPPRSWRSCSPACARSRTSRSSASARACRSSCPCASPRNCATCWPSSTRCG